MVVCINQTFALSFSLHIVTVFIWKNLGNCFQGYWWNRWCPGRWEGCCGCHSSIGKLYDIWATCCLYILGWPNLLSNIPYMYNVPQMVLICFTRQVQYIEKFCWELFFSSVCIKHSNIVQAYWARGAVLFKFHRDQWTWFVFCTVFCVVQTADK